MTISFHGGIFERLVDIHFPHQEVLVVFYGSGGPISCSVVPGKATLLATQSLRNTLYLGYFVRVKPTTNGVIAVTTGHLHDPFYAAVCSFDKTNISTSIANANAIASQLLFDVPSGAPIPSGLLFWSGIGSGSVPLSPQVPWKITYANHLQHGPAGPPNTMVQCFPLSITPNSDSSGFPYTVTGFNIIAYRCDKAGKGPVYGCSFPNSPASPGAPVGWATDVIFRNALAADYGCAFPASGNLPLISGDVPYGS